MTPASMRDMRILPAGNVGIASPHKPRSISVFPALIGAAVGNIKVVAKFLMYLLPSPGSDLKATACL